jgi:hypothetical protein
VCGEVVRWQGEEIGVMLLSEAVLRCQSHAALPNLHSARCPHTTHNYDCHR